MSLLFWHFESELTEFERKCKNYVPAIQDKALAKLVAEFNFLRAHSNEPLSTFLDYIT